MYLDVSERTKHDENKSEPFLDNQNEFQNNRIFAITSQF